MYHVTQETANEEWEEVNGKSPFQHTHHCTIGRSTASTIMCFFQFYREEFSIRMHRIVQFSLIYIPRPTKTTNRIRSLTISSPFFDFRYERFVPRFTYIYVFLDLFFGFYLSADKDDFVYVDLVRDLLSPFEPSTLHYRISQDAAMPDLLPVRSFYFLEFEHDPSLFVNIYTNHHHRWGSKHAQSYILVEGTGDAAKAQIGDNLTYSENSSEKQIDHLQVTGLRSNIEYRTTSMCCLHLFRWDNSKWMDRYRSARLQSFSTCIYRTDGHRDVSPRGQWWITTFKKTPRPIDAWQSRFLYCLQISFVFSYI